MGTASYRILVDASHSGTHLVWPSVKRSMGPFIGLRDFWGQWSIDRAGNESGRFTLRDLKRMVAAGDIDPHTWLRHLWTRRYALVGEVLYQHGFASDEDLGRWFPSPKTTVPQGHGTSV